MSYFAGLLTGIGIGAFAYWLVVLNLIPEPVPILGWSPLVGIFAIAGEVVRELAVRRGSNSAAEVGIAEQKAAADGSRDSGSS